MSKMQKQTTMPLAEYLATEQARVDVRLGDRALDLCAGLSHEVARGWMRFDIVGTWRRVCLESGGAQITAYYRLDTDRYMVTDLGDGARALRLRGVDLLRVGSIVATEMYRMFAENLLHRIWGPYLLVGNEIGTVQPVEATDLPDAICRVMLTSLRGAGAVAKEVA